MHGWIRDLQSSRCPELQDRHSQQNLQGPDQPQISAVTRRPLFDILSQNTHTYINIVSNKQEQVFIIVCPQILCPFLHFFLKGTRMPDVKLVTIYWTNDQIKSSPKVFLLFFLSFKNHLLSPLVNLLFEAILNIRDGKFGFADWLPPRSLSIVSMAFTKLSSIVSLVNKKIQMIRQKYESDNQRYKTAWKMCNCA